MDLRLLPISHLSDAYALDSLFSAGLENRILLDQPGLFSLSTQLSADEPRILQELNRFIVDLTSGPEKLANKLLSFFRLSVDNLTLPLTLANSRSHPPIAKNKLLSITALEGEDLKWLSAGSTFSLRDFVLTGLTAKSIRQNEGNGTEILGGTGMSTTSSNQPLAANLHIPESYRPEIRLAHGRNTFDHLPPRRFPYEKAEPKQAREGQTRSKLSDGLKKLFQNAKTWLKRISDRSKEKKNDN